MGWEPVEAWFTWVATASYCCSPPILQVPGLSSAVSAFAGFRRGKKSTRLASSWVFSWGMLYPSWQLSHDGGQWREWVDGASKIKKDAGESHLDRAKANDDDKRKAEASLAPDLSLIRFFAPSLLGPTKRE